MSETAVKLPRDWNGVILCRECGTPLYFLRGALCHPDLSQRCPLEAKYWKVERPTLDAIETDEAPA